MEQYIGFAIAVAVIYVAYKYFKNRKNAKKGSGSGDVKNDNPPTMEK